MDSLWRLRNEVRKFVAQCAADGLFEPMCDAWMQGHSLEFSRRLGRMGWLGMTWPRVYGGHERSILERFTVIEELLGAGAPVSAHWITDRQTGPLLLKYGSEEQKKAYLPAMARGEIHFSIGLSEPDSGSDLASIRTRAVPVDGGWSVTGRKIWTSNGATSHYLLALVRTAEYVDSRHEGLSQLIVDLSADGVDVRPIQVMTGESHFAEIALNEVFVPDLSIVGSLGQGWPQVMAELGFERSGPERFMSTFPLMDLLCHHSRNCSSCVGYDGVGYLVSRAWSLRALSRNVAVALQEDRDCTVDAAIVKDLGSRFEQDIAYAARDLASQCSEFRGSHGREVHHALLSSPGFTLRGGTNEILRGIIAGHVGAR
jgi:hypothetical protein